MIALWNVAGGPAGGYRRDILCHAPSKSRGVVSSLIDWDSAYFVLDYYPGVTWRAFGLRGGGENSHPAVVRLLVAERIPGAAFVTIAGAAHFMIATHPAGVAKVLAAHMHRKLSGPQ